MNYYPHVPLKEMDGAMLAFEMLAELQSFPDSGRAMIASAAQLATHLHRGQTRRERANLPKVPYIEHPMRVSIRLMRWGVRDADVVTAALLHDTIEDCAARIVQNVSNRSPDEVAAMNAEELRPIALDWVRKAYSPEVQRVVGLVTNPVNQSRDQYTDHVRMLCERSDGALLVKASDLVDNAGSLRHQVNASGASRTLALASKYREPLEIVHEALLRQDSVAPMRNAADHIDAVRGSVIALAGELGAHERLPNVAVGGIGVEVPSPDLDPARAIGGLAVPSGRPDASAALA